LGDTVAGFPLKQAEGTLSPGEEVPPFRLAGSVGIHRYGEERLTTWEKAELDDRKGVGLPFSHEPMFVAVPNLESAIPVTDR
jgi:hypothetical protein